MKTQEIKKGSSFAQLKEELNQTNKAAKNAIAEHRDAATPVSNPTGVAKRLAKRAAVASGGEARKMPSKKVSQRGINITAENARKVNKALDTFLPTYVSPIPELDLRELEAMYIEAKRLEKHVVDVSKKQSVYLKKRGAYYKALNSLGAQIVNMIKACGADRVTVSDARKCLKKMQGVRIIPINPNKPNEKHISVAHTGFEDKLAFFGELIEIADNYAGYAIVTGDLSIASLQLHYDAINDANDPADTSGAEADAARRVRNAYFNTEITGLVDTYQRVKSNVKAMYGTVSAEYKAIGGLAFRKIVE